MDRAAHCILLGAAAFCRPRRRGRFTSGGNSTKTKSRRWRTSVTRPLFAWPCSVPFKRRSAASLPRSTQLQQSASVFVFIFAANSTILLIGSARDGRSVWDTAPVVHHSLKVLQHPYLKWAVLGAPRWAAVRLMRSAPAVSLFPSGEGRETLRRHAVHGPGWQAEGCAAGQAQDTQRHTP